MIVPFAAAVAKLDEITGIGIRAAQEIIAEIGGDMTVFPTAAHLASWAKFAPIDARSARQEERQLHRQGQPLASRHPRRSRRRNRPHQHLPRRTLPPPDTPTR
ncbi:transposase [Micromonospora sp. DT47]|uniref:transposase n=1 Tax=Micromonospora sp. DT47 TaxID=3393431 RepID=UPI003CEA157A